MKVCMLTTSFPRSKEDASGVFIYRLCRALNVSNIQVDVVAPADKGSPLIEEVEGVRIHRFRYFFPEGWQRLAYGAAGGIPANMGREPWLLVQVPFFILLFTMNSLRVAKDADIIHANWVYTGFIAWIIKIIRGTPFIVTLRGSDVQRTQKKNFNYFLSLWIFKRAAFITTVNQSLRDWVIEQGIPEDRVTCIRNGVGQSCTEERKRSSSSCRFLFVGSLIPRKGLEYLIDALFRVVQEEKNLVLTVIGRGSEEEKLRKRISEYNLKGYVSFVGAQAPDRIENWMIQSDCLVLPSLWEGTPNVVLEAMACGLPVVASDLPGIKEIVKPGEHGLLFQPKNVIALSQHILAIIRDRDARIRMGNNAIKAIANLDLTWEKCAERYEECYIKTCAASQASSI